MHVVCCSIIQVKTPGRREVGAGASGGWIDGWIVPRGAGPSTCRDRVASCTANNCDSLVVGAAGKRFPVGQRAVGLVALAGFADGGVDLRPFLRFIFGFEEMADGAEAVGVALAGFGEQDEGSAQVVVWAGELPPGPNPEPDVQVSKHPALQTVLRFPLPPGLGPVAWDAQRLHVVQRVRLAEAGKVPDGSDMVRV